MKIEKLATQSQIKWIYTPDEICESIKVQINNQLFRQLRKLTIQNIKMKILVIEIQKLNEVLNEHNTTKEK